MNVEISNKDGQVQSQTRRDGTITYSQRGYLDTGSAYPLAFKIPLNDANAYPAGKYILSGTSFKCGQYGDLEIDRFGLSLLKVA